MALVTTNCTETVAQVKAKQKCQYVMNCTLYNYNTLSPCCVYRTHGVTVTKDKCGYWCYAWNNGNDIKMVHSNDIEKYQYAFACSALIKDGANTVLKYNKDQGGVRGRSAVGIDSSGNLILFCSKDGTSGAQTPEKLRETMRGLGCASAIMVDSGTSSSCDFNGKTITSARKVANYLCVWTEDTSSDNTTPSTTENPYDSPTRTLKAGCKGEDVQWLQWKLNKAGYGCGSVDGDFGSGTKSAVIKFQKANGLVADGIVGVNTRAKLS